MIRELDIYIYIYIYIYITSIIYKDQMEIYEPQPARLLSFRTWIGTCIEVTDDLRKHCSVT
jgi:hypothetical protein